MYWEINSKYYSIIVRVNYKKKLLLYTHVCLKMHEINV